MGRIEFELEWKKRGFNRLKIKKNRRKQNAGKIQLGEVSVRILGIRTDTSGTKMKFLQTSGIKKEFLKNSGTKKKILKLQFSPPTFGSVHSSPQISEFVQFSP